MKKNIQFIPDAELQIIFNILAGKTSSDVKELLEVNQKDKYPNLEQYSYKINNANWSLTLPEIKEIYIKLKSRNSAKSILLEKVIKASIKSGIKIGKLSYNNRQKNNLVNNESSNKVESTGKSKIKKPKEKKIKGALTVDSPLIEFRGKKLEHFLDVYKLEVKEIQRELKGTPYTVDKNSILTTQIFNELLDYFTAIKKIKAPQSIKKIRFTSKKRLSQSRIEQIPLPKATNSLSSKRSVWTVKKK
ncbi:MAG: hypothetical protein IPG12_10965 [Saprospiraceae bacterium]|nr:hypothetical protein [Saprospiraceae bacterium]